MQRAPGHADRVAASSVCGSERWEVPFHPDVLLVSLSLMI